MTHWPMSRFSWVTRKFRWRQQEQRWIPGDMAFQLATHARNASISTMRLPLPHVFVKHEAAALRAKFMLDIRYVIFPFISYIYIYIYICFLGYVVQFSQKETRLCFVFFRFLPLYYVWSLGLCRPPVAACFVTATMFWNKPGLRPQTARNSGDANDFEARCLHQLGGRKPPSQPGRHRKQIALALESGR